MTDPNRNARWARLVAEDLHRGGVGHAILCPGSRNAPLLFALATAFGDDAISHVDERSAGIISLGLARATGRPAVVCVTSGSALANLLPAVVEADAAGVPLVVLSADRPWELHDCGAQQAMRQRGILGPFVHGELAAGEPTDDDRSLRSLRRQVSRLAQVRDGPVHLNLPLRDPLPPLQDPAWNPPPASPVAEHGRDGAFTVSSLATAALDLPDAPWLRPGVRGLIVVGCLPLDAELRVALQRLARNTGFPLLADGPSHLRRPDTPHLVTLHDGLVGGVLAEAEPELVIQVGPAPLTRAAYEWLDRWRCPWISVSDGANQDVLARAWLALGWRGPALDRLGERLASGDTAWRERWLSAESGARGRLATAMADLPWGESAVVHRAVRAAGFAFLHVASSMAVRHANLHLPLTDSPVHANRGVNGIDGTLGTFLGLSRGTGRAGAPAPGLLLVGDLAFLHDLPALAGAELGRGAIVLLNNGGGAIFDYLPVAAVPGYDRWVRTAHRRTFAAAGILFGMPYHPCRTFAELDAALAAAAVGDSPHLIECLLPVGAEAVSQHRTLVRTCGNVT